MNGLHDLARSLASWRILLKTMKTSEKAIISGDDPKLQAVDNAPGRPYI